MKRLFLITLLISSFLLSCTEEFELQFDEKQKLVIDAELTNGRPPYYVNLSVSGESIDKIPRKMSEEVVIIISDDMGIVDTLIPASDSIMDYDLLGGEIIDSSLIYNYDFEMKHGSFFQTTKIRGKAGHTYHLHVEWRNQIFTSECTMPKEIKIDSLTSRPANKFDDGAVHEIPYVWFADDPTEDNYYLFKKGYKLFPISFSTGQGMWSTSLLSDELLVEGTHGVDVCKGVSVESWRRDGWNFSYYNPIHRVIMYSITKEAYEYYNSLQNQIRYDGGVYTPSPASAPTNIRGGALGFFNVASVDEKLCVCTEEEENSRYVW